MQQPGIDVTHFAQMGYMKKPYVLKGDQNNVQLNTVNRSHNNYKKKRGGGS